LNETFISFSFFFLFLPTKKKKERQKGNLFLFGPRLLEGHFLYSARVLDCFGVT